jgi:hypothetical protein
MALGLMFVWGLFFALVHRARIWNKASYFRNIYSYRPFTVTVMLKFISMTRSVTLFVVDRKDEETAAYPGKVLQCALFIHFSSPRATSALNRPNALTGLFFLVAVQAVREVVQAVVHSLHTPADPLGHATLPMPVLWQALPPEVRHEETHLHPHRWVIYVFTGLGEKRRNAMWRDGATVSAPREENMAIDIHATVLWQPKMTGALHKHITIPS